MVLMKRKKPLKIIRQSVIQAVSFCLGVVWICAVLSKNLSSDARWSHLIDTSGSVRTLFHGSVGILKIPTS